MHKLVRDSLQKISILFWQDKIAATKRPIKKLALRVQLENKETHFFCLNANHYQTFYSSGRCKYLNGHCTFYSSIWNCAAFTTNKQFLAGVKLQKSKWGKFCLPAQPFVKYLPCLGCRLFRFQIMQKSEEAAVANVQIWQKDLCSFVNEPLCAG